MMPTAVPQNFHIKKSLRRQGHCLYEIWCTIHMTGSSFTASAPLLVSQATSTMLYSCPNTSGNSSLCCRPVLHDNYCGLRRWWEMFIQDNLGARDIFVLIARQRLGWLDCAELLHPPGKLFSSLWREWKRCLEAFVTPSHRRPDLKSRCEGSRFVQIASDSLRYFARQQPWKGFVYAHVRSTSHVALRSSWRVYHRSFYLRQ